MTDESLKTGYAAAQLQIERLEAWIEQAISAPCMSRAMRTVGLELVEEVYRQKPWLNQANPCPEVRAAVERICPSQSRGLEHSLQIER